MVMDRVILRVINAKYSVPTWLLAIMSWLVAIIILLIAMFDPAQAADFLDQLPAGGFLWAPLLLASTSATMVGMARHWHSLVKNGAGVSFCLWIFGSVAFGVGTGIANVVAFCVPFLIYWFYLALAARFRERQGDS